MGHVVSHVSRISNSKSRIRESGHTQLNHSCTNLCVRGQPAIQLEAVEGAGVAFVGWVILRQLALGAIVRQPTDHKKFWVLRVM